MGYIIAIIIFALFGLFVSLKIAKTKNTEQNCRFGKSCDAVIYSRFSHFLGIRNEYLGIFYYLIIAAFYLASLIFNIPSHVSFYILLITSLAFLFNFYLVFVQLFVLKKWCTFCLWSSASSFLILVLSFLAFHASFGAYLFEVHDVLFWAFDFFVILGFFASFFYARKFLRYMQNFEISEKEEKQLALFSHLAWVAIFGVLLIGIGIVMTDIYGNITQSSKFMPILMLIAFLMTYEVYLNHFTVPHLIDIHFGRKEAEDHHISFLRKKAFAFMVFGLVSWLSLILLSVFPFFSYTPLQILAIYFVFVVLGVGVASYLEHLYAKRAKLVAQTIEEIDFEEKLLE